MIRLTMLAAAAVLGGAQGAQACSYNAKVDVLSTSTTGPTYAGAEGRDWYRSGAPITVWSKRYERYGLPRVFGNPDFVSLTRLGEWQGVIVFTDEEDDGAVVYVPVNAGNCTFQPYQRVGP